MQLEKNFENLLEQDLSSINGGSNEGALTFIREYAGKAANCICKHPPVVIGPIISFRYFL